ncbi:vWA domain-containing protein [Virgibacillus ainsalahensis]
MVIVGCTSDEKSESQNSSSNDVENGSQNTESPEEGNSDSENNTSNWKEELAAPEPPKTIDEVFTYSAGEFSDFNYQDNETDREELLKGFSNLPQLEEGASKEKIDAFWNKTLSLTYADYPDIDAIVNQIQATGYGSPDIEDPRYHLKENLNVEIILDASGSMAGVVDGGTKMNIAKETINSFVGSLPEEAKIGLRVYGHEGSSSESDKALSCKSSELVYQLNNYSEDEFNKALNRFTPAGWTPIALALENAKQDLAEYSKENNTNIIYLVSDGIGTCDEDPAVVAETLPDSDIMPIVNVIGFDIDQDGANQLKKIADAAEGSYSAANTESELRNELEKAEHLAAQWKSWKGKARTEVVYQHSQNRGDVTWFYNDFVQDYLRQSENIKGVLRDLEESGHISEEAYRALDEKRSEWYDMMGDFIDQKRTELYEMADNVEKSLKKSIENEAEENTN